MLIDLEKYELDKTYFRDGRKCIIDKTKNILRILNPEEIVRQKTIQFLVTEMKIPMGAIETEIPLSYFSKGAKGRMDIIVYGKSEGNTVPVLIVECKANEVPLTDEVFLQANTYAETIDSPFIMITNGIEAEIYYWNKNKTKYESVSSYPSYDQLCAPDKVEKLDIPPYAYYRLSYEELFSKEILDDEYEAGNFLGRACPQSMAPHFLNLGECLLDDSHKIHHMDLYSKDFEGDGGVRFTEFGNASGGSYPGLYRYVLVKDNEGNTQIVSFSVMGCLNGRTLLIVAIDDFDSHHNSLQLSLDHFSVVTGNELFIYHDGTLTAGKKGKVGREKVLNYVATNSKLQIHDGKIELGRINISDLMYTDSADIQNLLTNLVEYALVRDSFRKQY